MAIGEKPSRSEEALDPALRSPQPLNASTKADAKMNIDVVLIIPFTGK
jgi:hypothetical protein